MKPAIFFGELVLISASFFHHTIPASRHLVIAATTQQQPAMPSILSPSDVMQKGLGYIGIGREQQAKMSLKVKVEDFKAHYGSSPLVIADIWHDLCHTSIEEARLEEKETSEKGFKRYMIALFFGCIQRTSLL